MDKYICDFFLGHDKNYHEHYLVSKFSRVFFCVTGTLWHFFQNFREYPKKCHGKKHCLIHDTIRYNTTAIPRYDTRPTKQKNNTNTTPATPPHTLPFFDTTRHTILYHTTQHYRTTPHYTKHQITLHPR